MKFKVISLSSMLLILAACNNADKSTTTTVVEKRTSFFDKSGMDTLVKPGDNFYNYANGAWVKTTVIPDDQTGWGGFYTLYEDNLKKLRSILEEASKSNAAKGSIEQKTGDYYTAGMDTAAIEKKGAEPLKEMLAKIDAVKDYKELVNLIAENNANGWSDIMGFSVGADEKNSKKYIPVFSQSGLSLPEMGYYSRRDSGAMKIRAGLTDYAAKLFTLTGLDPAKANAVLAVETELAKSHRTPAETRDPQKNYNKMAVADLQKMQPNTNWDNYFAKMNVKPDSVDIQQPGYFTALNNLLASQPIDVWKTKLKFDYISSNASLLPKDFRDVRFKFVQMFSGQKKQSERWKTIVQRDDTGLGELLGQLYVKKYFTEKAKQRMDELVSNLQTAFDARIKKADWMNDSTKQRASIKLKAFLKKIGYPAKWKNYDDVNIDKSDFYGSAISIQKHNKKVQVHKIGTDVDRAEWDMTPPTVNAYYNASNNEIVFPAGILQFPFFDENADDAINYGGIGMVIGHEMTHGFDDQGSQYDETGNMANWWNKDDLTKFKAKSAGVVKQYNAFTLLGLHVNGELTLGENLADIGGIAIAYDAFKLTKQGQGNEKIDGLTPDERFFLGFAQVWRSANREESIRVRLNTDPHSPDIFRINGVLSNFDPFYKTFNVKEGDSMYIKPESRAHIW